jgi:hypothetical protein
MTSIKKWLWLLIIPTVLSLILFSYKQNLLNFSTGINAERFADFAIFVSAFFCLLTIILLYFTYQQTRETHQVTISTYEQTKKDSVDNTFFNLIQNHRSIVEHLHSRITLDLQVQFEELNEKCGRKYGEKRDKDFFELMYRMLDLEYKCNDIRRDISKVTSFFKKHNWLMGHYLRSVLYFIKWVEGNNEINLEQKRFYIGFIQAQLTSDETRLLFYYVISTEDQNEKKFLKRFLSKYNFFETIKNELIYQENNQDWNEFLIQETDYS